MRAVKIGRVDVIDPGSDRLAQDGEGCLFIARRTEDHRAGELHGAVSHAADGEVGSGKGEAAAQAALVAHHMLLSLL